ncbi:hypothetical protein AMECASPLE_024405 [Ameca splendens]|uniref:Uncharacterized protein n=1 Tax=Ameca splendens TaxID=208324 RepID=A0ABV0YFM3_9TELE
MCQNRSSCTCKAACTRFRGHALGSAFTKRSLDRIQRTPDNDAKWSRLSWKQQHSTHTHIHTHTQDSSFCLFYSQSNFLLCQRSYFNMCYITCDSSIHAIPFVPAFLFLEQDESAAPVGPSP